MQEENPGVRLSTIAVKMWKRVLKKSNLTTENKTPEEITASAKKFRELFKNNTYTSNDVVKEIKIVESAERQFLLEKQISMFPEAGKFKTSWMGV